MSRRALFGRIGGRTAKVRSSAPSLIGPGLGPRMVVAASERCCHQRVCVARCPTEALIPYAVDGRVGIAVAVERCTGCGVCTETCPEQALRLHPAGAEPASEYLVLTAHRPKVCPGCDEPFVARDGQGLCPLCRKDRTLFSDLAKALRP